MRASFVVLPLGFLAALSPAFTATHAQTIPANTAIEIKLDQTISSQGSKPNQRVRAELANDVIVNGEILLPKGAKAAVYVEKVQPGGDSAKPASLWLRLDAIAAHGRAYPVFAQLAGEQLAPQDPPGADPPAQVKKTSDADDPDADADLPPEVTYASTTILKFQLKSPVHLR
jgi:hypothetical protein